jgi:chemotaxis methyl-accepting protein methylase
MDDKEFSQLLQYLGLSWQGYRKVRKGVKKRIGRHMQSLGCGSIRDYLQALEQHTETRAQCELATTVPISRFFRDRILWKVLESHLLPELISAGRDRIRVWSAGCACGEEVYSLKILWEQMRRSADALPVLDIMATDLHPIHLERAEAAVYSLGSLREVPEDTKAAWFEAEPDGSRFRVNPALRTGIVWRRHDCLSGPPGLGFDLILARNNLLTYYESFRIRAALEAMAGALAAGGYLIIGSREKLPFQPSALQPCPVLPFVFKRAA